MPRFKLNFIFLCAGVTIIIIVSILIFEDNTTGVKVSILGGTFNPEKRSLDTKEIIFRRNLTLSVHADSVNRNAKYSVTEKGKDSWFGNSFFEEIHFRCQAPFPVEWKYAGNGVSHANVFNQRLVKNIDDPSSYMYVSSLVFGEMRPFTNESAGKYYCTPRKTNESLAADTFPENTLGYYDVEVAYGVAYDSPGFHNFTQKSCNASAQNSPVNFYFNDTEQAFYCCGDTNTNTATIVSFNCEVPSACKLVDKCSSEKFKCTEVYNETFSIGQSTCTKTNSLTHGTNTGEMDCILDNQCGKFMTYVRGLNFVGNVFYPMDSTDIVVPTEKVLRIRSNIHSNSLFFSCEGPIFYLEFGFKWIIKKKDGTAQYVLGKDGDFGPLREVFSELTIDLETAMDVSSVTCVAPLLNSPTKWIEISTTDIPV